GMCASKLLPSIDGRSKNWQRTGWQQSQALTHNPKRGRCFRSQLAEPATASGRESVGQHNTGMFVSISSKPLSHRVRTLLVLGRVSNLPTVWSNCLAAWLLAGGGPWSRLGLVALGSSFIYTGGMFLNDAFDIEFDRKHRPERPIISGEASPRFV